MKRWMLVVLLLVVPLTLAPRTSMNPEGSALQLTGMLSRTEIRPGGTVNLVVQARNTTAETADNARVVITVFWDGDPAALQLTTSRFCAYAPEGKESLVQCNLGSLRPGQLKTLRITARALGEGTLGFEPSGSSTFGPIPDGTRQVVRVVRR